MNNNTFWIIALAAIAVLVVGSGALFQIGGESTREVIAGVPVTFELYAFGNDLVAFDYKTCNGHPNNLVPVKSSFFVTDDSGSVVFSRVFSMSVYCSGGSLGSVTWNVPSDAAGRKYVLEHLITNENGAVINRSFDAVWPRASGQECVNGAMKCGNEGATQLTKCENNHWTAPGTHCASGCSQATNACISPCSPGAKKCVNSGAQAVCKIDAPESGSYWYETGCTNGCVNGACATPAPVPTPVTNCAAPNPENTCSVSFGGVSYKAGVILKDCTCQPGNVIVGADYWSCRTKAECAAGEGCASKTACAGTPGPSPNPDGDNTIWYILGGVAIVVVGYGAYASRGRR